MSLSSLTGDGSLAGDGAMAGDGAVAGSALAGAAGGGSISPYSSGALVTTRDGIVGSWTSPKSGKEPKDAALDVGRQMRRWEARVRGQVLDFVLLSAFKLQVDPEASAATFLVRDEDDNKYELVELVRPSADYLLKNQLFHVFNYADLRRDRAPEILSQIKGIELFFGALTPFHPERHHFTLELLEAFYRALVSAEMRIKHALAVPRPVEFSPQIMPMIQTPGHGSFPAGHASESFMVATVISALMGEAQSRYAGWDDKLARLAARISVNRVIAGMHFPIDLAAGLVLGLAAGHYFVALAKGSGKLNRYKFDSGAYGNRDFPGEQFSWSNILKTGATVPSFVSLGEEPFTLKPSAAEHSPLRWLWSQAVEEWK